MKEESNRLYPFRFIDEGEDFPWGHVSYHLADLGFKDSMVDDGWFAGNTLSELMETYLERVVGDDVFEFYGLQFPVILKVMNVVKWQPLQVNASDELAAQRYDAFGKTSLWYIEEASENAEMYLGFNRDVDAGEFYRRCEDGSVTDVLNAVHPKKGDCFLIEPGTVHAAGPGLKIVEIAECSELSFNLLELGDDSVDAEDILLEEAFDLINFHGFIAPDSLASEEEAAETGAVKLARRPEFTVTKLNLKNPLHIFSEQPGSFALYYCVSGEFSLQIKMGKEEASGDVDHYEIKAGHSILVPSELNDFLIAPMDRNTVLLETLVEKRMVRDSYTNEDVEPNALESGASDSHVRDFD